MNYTRLRQWRIDRDNLDNLVADGLVTPEQAEALVDEFVRNMQIAMETKGHATPADLYPVPRSEILRRFRKGESHAAAGVGA